MGNWSKVRSADRVAVPMVALPLAQIWPSSLGKKEEHATSVVCWAYDLLADTGPPSTMN